MIELRIIRKLNYIIIINAKYFRAGHEQRFRRSDVTRRSATKKSMTELTDSGVSVVSDVPPSVSKDVRLPLRFKEADKKVELKHSSRHGKRYGSSRSGSLERPNRETWNKGVPAQPFIADPGMPPLTPPHTVGTGSCLFFFFNFI